MVLSQALIFDLYNKGTDKGIELHGLLVDQLNKENDELEQLKRTTTDMAAKAAELNEIINQGGLSWSTIGKLRKIYFDKFGVELSEASSAIKANNMRIMKGAKHVNDQKRVYRDQERRGGREALERMLNNAKEQEAADEQVSKEHHKLIKKRIKSLEKLYQYQENLRRDIENIETRGLTTKRNSLRDELDAHQKLVDKSTETYEEGNAERVRLEAEGAKTAADIKYKSLLESGNRILDFTEALTQEALDLESQTTDEQIKREEQKRIDSLDKISQEELKYLEGTVAEKSAIALMVIDAIEKLEEFHTRKALARRKELNREFAEEVAAETMSLKESELSASELLYRNYYKRLAYIQEHALSDSNKKAAAESYKLKKRALGKELFASIRNVKEVGARSLRLKAKAERSGFGVFKKFALQRSKMQERMFKLESKRQEYEKVKSSLSSEERFLAEREMADEAHAIKSAKMKFILKMVKAVGKAAIAAAKGVVDIGKKGGEAFKFLSDFQFDLRGIVGEFNEASKELSEKGAKFDVKAEAAKKVTELVGHATGFMKMAVDAVPALLSELTAQLPVLFETFAESVPEIINGFADNIGGLVQVIVDNIPTMLTAVLSALPNLATVLAGAIVEIIKAIPAIIDALVAELPAILDALIVGLVQIIYQLSEALPIIIAKIIDIIPILIEAIVAAIPILIPALIRLLMQVITSAIGAISTIMMMLVDALPVLVTALVEMLPEVLKELFAMLPALFGAIIDLIPMIVLGFFKAILGAVGALVTAFINEFLPQVPAIIGLIVESILLALLDGIMAIGEAIGDLFRTKKGKEKAKERRAEADAEKQDKLRSDYDINSIDLENYYSGIKYVPSNMRVNVHEGEAIIPANRNAANSRGGAQQPLAGSGGSGSMGQSAPIDIAIMAEGRLLDAVQITAMKRGNAPGISKQLTRASGVTVGLDRGRFNYWTKKS